MDGLGESSGGSTRVQMRDDDVTTGGQGRRNVDTGTHQPEPPPKQVSSEDLLLAATLVRDAMADHNMNYKPDTKSIRSYLLYNHIAFKIVLQICLWANLLLALFEKPAVPNLKVPYWGTMIIEVFLLSYFLFRLFHNSSFAETTVFWRDAKNLTAFVIILLTIIDMIVYIVWVNVSAGGVEEAVRWSRPLRPFLLINFPEGRQMRKAFRNIRRTLPDIIYVLILFMASIALFALMGMKLLMTKELEFPDGSAYFNNYWESFWSLYVLVTTANNPDVMMPAYDSEQWFAIFFIIYLLVNLYVFMNIVLAVIYNNYKKHLKNEVKSNVYTRRRLLSRAFLLLCEVHQGEAVVTEARWHELLRVVDPKRSTTEVRLLFYVLARDMQSRIIKEDFLKAGDLLNVELKEVSHQKNVFEHLCPRLYLSTLSKFVCEVVKTRYFQWFFDFLILLNAVFIGLSLDEAEWFFLAVFIVEILLRIYAHGPRKYFRGFWNVFDFTIIALTVIVTIVDSALAQDDVRTKLIDVLMILRILRLLRLAGSFERFRVVLITIVNIGPPILTYGAIIFVVYYFYAIIGMEAFNGLIKFHGYDENVTDTALYCGTDKLAGSEFYTKRYCNNNFNDVLHAFVVLFELMVVNQWHVIANGFVLVTNQAARLYFISFHMICVVVILNIFTAFILEIFILQYTLSHGSLEAALGQRIKDMGLCVGQKPTFRLKAPAGDKLTLVDEVDETPPDTPHSNEEISLRFKLSETGSRNVETLLQLMFEGEIEPDDEGATYNEDADDKTKLTLNNVL